MLEQDKIFDVSIVMLVTHPGGHNPTEVVMNSQNGNLVAHAEPQSVVQAEQMVLHLKDEVARIQNQLADPERRSSMEEGEYGDWCQRAQMAVRHKKSAIRHLSLWARQQAKKAGEQDLSLHHINIGRSLKLAAKQYGRLVDVLLAAEEYINSPSEEDDEKLLAALTEKVMRAREIVRTAPVEAMVEPEANTVS